MGAVSKTSNAYRSHDKDTKTRKNAPEEPQNQNIYSQGTTFPQFGGKRANATRGRRVAPFGAGRLAANVVSVTQTITIKTRDGYLSQASAPTLI